MCQNFSVVIDRVQTVRRYCFDMIVASMIGQTWTSCARCKLSVAYLQESLLFRAIRQRNEFLAVISCTATFARICDNWYFCSVGRAIDTHNEERLLRVNKYGVSCLLLKPIDTYLQEKVDVTCSNVNLTPWREALQTTFVTMEGTTPCYFCFLFDIEWHPTVCDVSIILEYFLSVYNRRFASGRCLCLVTKGGT